MLLVLCLLDCVSVWDIIIINSINQRSMNKYIIDCIKRLRLVGSVWTCPPATVWVGGETWGCLSSDDPGDWQKAGDHKYNCK